MMSLKVVPTPKKKNQILVQEQALLVFFIFYFFYFDHTCLTYLALTGLRFPFSYFGRRSVSVTGKTSVKVNREKKPSLMFVSDGTCPKAAHASCRHNNKNTLKTLFHIEFELSWHLYILWQPARQIDRQIYIKFLIGLEHLNCQVFKWKKKLQPVIAIRISLNWIAVVRSLIE